MFELIDKLKTEHSLEKNEYAELIRRRNEYGERIKSEALSVKESIYGKDVFLRGLIEISSICKNDCYYCGLRHSNTQAERYRLTDKQILSCCDEGYELGFRTFVLQGGEDNFFTDERLCALIGEIKRRHCDCAVTLSLGERSYDSYAALKDAGADRYLLRHETANSTHYRKLHPQEMSYKHRMQCLRDLKRLGYQVGCGFMVGSPFQTVENIADDLKFIEVFKPDMCGIGPFVPHHCTPFANFAAGSVELCCFLLSIIRLIHPPVLLPATTALETIDPHGREKGILAGANVVMPNLSPIEVRSKYEIYDNKICTGEESAQCKDSLSRRIESIGCRVVVSRGDIIK